MLLTFINLEFDKDSHLHWFEFETKTRKLIKDVMISFDKQQKQHDASIQRIDKWLTENEDRLKELEFLIYKSDEKQSRFDDIYNKMV